MAYDILSELIGPQLSQALAAELLPKHSGDQIMPARLVKPHGYLKLISLSNKHFGENRLLCDEIPADELIPHRYEGCWMTIDGVRTPTAFDAVWHDGGILERFGNCFAVYA